MVIARAGRRRWRACSPTAASMWWSVPGNHAMDWGGEALLDTMSVMNDMGIETIGGGEDIESARRPVIFELNGVRIGFVGYSSVLRDGYAATTTSSGVAPMRAHAF